MARKSFAPIIRTVTEPLWRRDLLEMRAIDALVSTLRPKRKSSTRRSAAKPRRPPAKRPR
jgi:hypothetical protein